MLYLKRQSRYLGILFLLVPIIAFVLIFISYFGDRSKPTGMHIPEPVDSLYPERLPLFDLTNFKYLINNDVCGKEKIFAVIIIHSHPANRQRRDTMRQNIPAQDLVDLGMRRVFMLARAEWDDQDLYKKTPQAHIHQENTMHTDIIQGNFKEHYHNLTYKHTMGLQWASQQCSQASFVIKMDDDIIVDLYQMRDRLFYRYTYRQNLIVGLLQIEAKVIRDPTSKWYVSKDLMPKELYPNFVSGWVYAATMDAVRKLVAATRNHKFFWIDDAYITGILAEAVGIKREGWNSLYTIYSAHLKCCVEQRGYANYFCDFYAGPSEGDLRLMQRLLQHARSCYVNPCSRRPNAKSIMRTCVSVGQEYVHPLGVGQGQVIKLFK